jgi:hypothetical protein
LLLERSIKGGYNAFKVHVKAISSANSPPLRPQVPGVRRAEAQRTLRRRPMLPFSRQGACRKCQSWVPSADEPPSLHRNRQSWVLTIDVKCQIRETAMRSTAMRSQRQRRAALRGGGNLCTGRVPGCAWCTAASWGATMSARSWTSSTTSSSQAVGVRTLLSSPSAHAIPSLSPPFSVTRLISALAPPVRVSLSQREALAPSGHPDRVSLSQSEALAFWICYLF